MQNTGTKQHFKRTTSTCKFYRSYLIYRLKSFIFLKFFPRHNLIFGRRSFLDSGEISLRKIFVKMEYCHDNGIWKEDYVQVSSYKRDLGLSGLFDWVCKEKSTSFLIKPMLINNLSVGQIEMLFRGLNCPWFEV